MFRILCTFVAFIFAAQFGFAAKTVMTEDQAISFLTGKSTPTKTLKEAEDALANTQSSMKKLADSTANLKKQTNELTKQVETLQKEKEKADLEYRQSQVKNYQTKSGADKFKGDADKLQNLEYAKAKLAAAKKSLADSENDASDVRANKTYLMVQSTMEGMTTDARTKNLVTAMSADVLLMDFQKYKDKIGENDLALERLSNQLDKTNLGAYVQDKFGLFINSQLFCQASARCKVGDRKEVAGEEIQQVLFPGGSDASRKGNLYDKTHTAPSTTTVPGAR